MPRIERDRELARRRHRKQKIRKLKARFARSTNSGEKAEIVAKLRRISPFLEMPE